MEGLKKTMKFLCTGQDVSNKKQNVAVDPAIRCSEKLYIPVHDLASETSAVNIFWVVTPCNVADTVTCRPVYRQRLGKHSPAATNTQGTVG
jgi:hypothetical protein